MQETVEFTSVLYCRCIDMQAALLRENLATAETVTGGLIALWRTALARSAELSGLGGPQAS